MDILFPIGRLIGGSAFKTKPKTEQDGKTPKIGRDGRPQVSVSFGVAIPKTQANWRQEVWGNVLYEVGRQAFPQMHLNPSFAWKIVDGDSLIPNKSGKVPSNQAGHKGHWVIWFSQGWAPKLATADGSAELPGDRFVTGYYVQVFASVAGNGASGAGHTPGIYINPVAVALAGEGEVIVVDVDTTNVGFGGALPAGAKPVTSVVAAFAPAAPSYPPNAAFMTPPPPAPPSSPAAPVMLKNGATYDSYIVAGWSDAQIRQAGLL